MNTVKILILSLSLIAMATVAWGAGRNVTFNGQALTAQQETQLALLERAYGVRLPDRAYWYDNRTGAIGFWGGPAAAVIPAGLGWGGPMPANCSGGNTGVFVNGRELHYLDVVAISQITQVIPGRYWMTANGDVGYENGPYIGNLVQAANARGGGGGGGQHRVYSAGEIGGIIVNPAGAMTGSGTFYPGQ